MFSTVFIGGRSLFPTLCILVHPCARLVLSQCRIFAPSMISIDGCATERGDERRLSEPPFVVMLYTSMSGTGLHVYYRYLITNEGFSPEVTNGRLRRGADTADSKILNFYNNDNKKNNIYFSYI